VSAAPAVATRPSTASRIRTQARVVVWAVRTGLADHAVMFTWKTWLLGWFVRMMAQVLFFTTAGNLLGPGQARYLLVGNAVLMVGMHGLYATASTTWEQDNGTLPLLVASPSSPTLVLAGRSLFWLPDGLACGLGALVLLGPVAGLHVTVVTLLAALPPMIVTGVSTYCLGLFLGALVMAAPDLRNVVSNAMLTVVMALSGPEYPRSALGPVLGRAGAVLPLTHGLQAVRDVMANGPVLMPILTEIAVGACWCAVALLVLTRRARHSRRDGAMLFLN
jgi:ABC-2 type transport system permease protein